MSKELPEVNVKKLQQRIKDVELNTPFPKFEQLCIQVSRKAMCVDAGLDAEMVAKLIRHHKLQSVTKQTDKWDFSSVDVPEEPEEEKVEQEVVEDSRPIRQYDGPGKGRRQCPKCKTYVSIKTPRCVCGHVFERKQKDQPAPSRPSLVASNVPRSVPMPSGPMQQYGTLQRVSVPAGECPYPLKGTDLDTVRDWGEKVRNHFLDVGLFMKTSALVYFARYSYDINGKQFPIVEEHLESVFGSDNA